MTVETHEQILPHTFQYGLLLTPRPASRKCTTDRVRGMQTPAGRGHPKTCAMLIRLPGPADVACSSTNLGDM